MARSDEVVARPSPPAGRPLRGWGAVLVVLALAFGAGLVTEPAAPGGTDLLGRLDDASGRSSRLPPVDDLQLLWRRQVDALSATGSGPPRLVDLGGHVVVGEDVVDVTGATPAVHLPADAVPDADGRVVVAGADELVVVDVRTGRVDGRAALSVEQGWRPVGASLGWIAGAAILTDDAGVLGAVEPDGRVRWVGDPAWSWTATGNGTAWAVVVAAAAPRPRLLVVDGRDGSVQRDVGPVGVVHAPVVHGDTVAWVDPYGGLDRGLGHPVEVHGVRLDGSGRVWAVTDLPPTSGVVTAVRLAAAGPAGLVVQYWTAGQATTAVWLDPVDGTRRGQVAVSGTGTNREGWPLAMAGGDAVAHVDPARDEVRVVDRGGAVRWAVPAGPEEGVLVDGSAVLVRTPPSGVSLQSRLRLHDATTGLLLWDRVTDDTQRQRLAAVVGDHVGATAVAGPTTVGSHRWFDLDSGRRRAATGIAAALLDDAVPAADEAVLLGTVASAGAAVPVLQLPGGRLVGGAGSVGSADVGRLLAPPARGLPARVTRADGDVGVVVGAAAVTALDAATGVRRWHRTTSAALRAEATVLLDDLVVVLGWDGVVQALDRRDGSLRWTGPAGVTAVTAGGQELVLGLASGEVVVLGPDGTVRQRVRAGTAAVEDVAVVGGRVLVALGGDLVALGRGVAVVEPGDRVEVP